LANTNVLRSRAAQIEIIGEHENFWNYRSADSDNIVSVKGPVFEIGGVEKKISLLEIAAEETVALRNGAKEYSFVGTVAGEPGLSLKMIFRLSGDNPVVRFRYILMSAAENEMTKASGSDRLTYLGIAGADFEKMTEVRLSEFFELLHSFCLTENEVRLSAFQNNEKVMGPILFGEHGGYSTLLAYEHGSQVPDAFLEYAFKNDGAIALQAVKGNYMRGRILRAGEPYATIWMEICGVKGDENRLAEVYRDFVFRYMSLSPETRKPYVCYNTWSFSERNKWWNKKDYLTDMNNGYMLREVDRAHELGVDIFVIDCGWYAGFGDWTVDYKNFPAGLGEIRERLESYGMRLGIWYGPHYNDPKSPSYKEYYDCRQLVNGKPATEYSNDFMCLVSRYKEYIISEMLRMAREAGVTYFKLDGVGQYECNEPNHGHGDDRHTPQERLDLFAFEMPQIMNDIADAMTRENPEIIVDFDVTESKRSVGLSYLASGRYFLVNNGPYYQNYNIPLPPNTYNNVFVYPGEARAMVCRSPIGYDKWIPSALFLTHFLPDDPEDSQMINIVSMMLGQGGIWGDLLGISESGTAFITGLISKYKKVRNSAAESAPVRAGAVGASPEIHEKISGKNGEGLVAVFSSTSGSYTYVTRTKPISRFWASDGVTVTYLPDGAARLEFAFDKPGAKVVFFGEEV